MADAASDSSKDAGQPTAVSGIAAAAGERVDVPPPSLSQPLPEHRIQVLLDCVSAGRHPVRPDPMTSGPGGGLGPQCHEGCKRIAPWSSAEKMQNYVCPLCHTLEWTIAASQCTLKIFCLKQVNPALPC